MAKMATTGAGSGRGQPRAPGSSLDLPSVLFALLIFEFAVQRLAVPQLSPPVAVEPPTWHAVLSWLGLFLFYSAAALAVAVLGKELWRQLKEHGPYRVGPRYAMVFVATGFVVLASAAVVSVPSAELSFSLDLLFTLVIVAILIAQLTVPGDLGCKIGMILLASPLVMHFYAPLAAMFTGSDEIALSTLPERVRGVGQWSLVFAALATPYCFAPRPLLRSAQRILPIVVAVFTGVVAAVLFRFRPLTAIDIASGGFGIEIHTGTPSTMISLFILALVAFAWTAVSCLSSQSPARRQVGVGLALVGLSGYAFDWPLQYLAAVVGLLTIGLAATRVGDEEQGRTASLFRPPPIPAQAWRDYIAKLVEDFRAAHPVDAGSAAATAVTVKADGDDDRERTHVAAQLRDLSVKLSIAREGGSIENLDLWCSKAGDRPDSWPAWTLRAQPDDGSTTAHAPPPAIRADRTRTGDPEFDRRFVIRDVGQYTEHLLDDGARARAIGMVDGWMAFYPGYGLRLRLTPGRGAPLDHPIPISDLAFRGDRDSLSTEKLIALVELVVDMAAAALARDEADETDSDTDAGAAIGQ